MKMMMMLRMKMVKADEGKTAEDGRCCGDI